MLSQISSFPVLIKNLLAKTIVHRIVKKGKGREGNLLAQLIIAESYASAGTSDFCANYD